MKRNAMRRKRWALRGQGATEYGLILVLVAVVGLAALALLSNAGVQPIWSRVRTEITATSGSAPTPTPTPTTP